MHCDDSLLLVENFQQRGGNGGKGKGGHQTHGPGGGANLNGGGGARGQRRGGQGDGQGGGQGGGANLNGGGGQTQSAYGSVEDGFRAKELATCMYWNMKTCRNPDSCPKLHKCSFKVRSPDV